MADNPYANTSNGTFWAQGYNAAQAEGAGLFGKPPEGLTDGAVETWKEGWKAGKADAKAGVLMEQDTSDGTAPTPAAPAAPTAPAAAPSGGGSGGHAWNITLDGKQFENCSTDAAQTAIKKMAGGMKQKVDYYSGYQSEWHKCAPSRIMNWIIETAPGGKYEPDAAVWSTLHKEIAEVESASAAGDIAGAASKAQSTSEAIKGAAEAWHDFLDHFEEGGKAVIHGLGEVAKFSIQFEAVLIDIATDGAGGAAAAAAIGAGNGGLTEMVDQWVDINTGERKEFDWGKITEDAVISGVLDGATHGLSEQWGEKVAEHAPKLVGAKTDLMARIADEFIDKETGAKLNPAQMAEKLEPLWGKILTKIPPEAAKKAVEAGIRSQPATEADFANQIGMGIDDASWQSAVESALADEGYQRG